MPPYRRLVVIGLLLWAAGTVLLRLAPARVMPVDNIAAILLIFTASFAACAWLVPAACDGAQLARDAWPSGAIAILAPTLLLDPFSSAFFPIVFPNLPPDAGGVFGGWMLCCCAGGLLGARLRRGARG